MTFGALVPTVHFGESFFGPRSSNIVPPFGIWGWSTLETAAAGKWRLVICYAKRGDDNEAEQV
jgi:hypothetical protein